MDDLDQLLAQVKAESEQSTQRAEQGRAGEGERSPSPAPNPQPRLSIDALLAGIETEPTVKQSRSVAPSPTEKLPQPQSWQSLGSIVSGVELVFDQDLTTPQHSPEDSLLAEIKATFTERDQAEALEKQQQLQAEQLRQQQIQQQQLAALTVQAQDWLKKLELLSDEGLWFEEFSSRYPSKLEAAIDYLQALAKPQSGIEP